MKKLFILFVLTALFSSSIFAKKIRATVELDVGSSDRKETPEIPVIKEKNENAFTHLYWSIGTSSIASFGETLFTYIAKENGSRDNFYVPYFYSFQTGFDHYINNFVGFGIEFTYENGSYKSDSEASDRKYNTDLFCSKYGFMGKFTFSPSRYIYTSVSLGAMFKTSDQYKDWLLVLPAINYCPFGCRLPINENWSTYFEFNLGSVSCFDLGLSVAF